MIMQQKILITIFYALIFSTTVISVESTPIVRDLAIHEKTVYAEVKYFHPYLDEKTAYFYSTDGGQNWAKIDFQLPTEVIKQLSKSEELPLKLCLLENQDICYQTDDESILESNDGGETWFISWDIPEGRREFLKRKSFGYFSLGPFDIIQIEVNNQQIVIASFGTEGLLIKDDNDEWRPVGLSGAGPMYFDAKSFIEATNVASEELFIFCCIAFFFFYINLHLNIIKKKNILHYLLSILPVLTIVLFIILIFFTDTGNSNLLVIKALFFLVCLFISIIVVLQQFFKNTNKRAKINLIPIILVTLISYSLFILWTYGTIPVHETAQWISIGLHVLLLLWILYFPIKEFIQAKSSHPKPDLHK